MSDSIDQPGAEVVRSSLGFGCGGRNVDDNDDTVDKLVVSASSSSIGNSNLVTRSRTDIHLNVKHSFTFSDNDTFSQFSLQINLKRKYILHSCPIKALILRETNND